MTAAAALEIVAVAMLDWQTFGSDRFFVQVDAEHVMLYEAHRDGEVTAVIDEPAPLAFVDGSVEKFGSMYRLMSPVTLDNVEGLAQMVGQFEIIDDQTARYIGP